MRVFEWTVASLCLVVGQIHRVYAGISDHFRGVTKMVELGSGFSREIANWPTKRTEWVVVGSAIARDSALLRPNM